MSVDGFFVILFKQFVALLSAFCIAPTSNAPNIAAANLGPPGSPSIQVAQYVGADPAAALRQEPFIARVIQTQINGLLDERRGIGFALARTADGISDSILDAPEALRRALDNGGLESLPAGLALYGMSTTGTLERNTIRLIDALEALALANLQLLPGGVGPAQVAQFVAPEDEFGAIGRALLGAPEFFLRTLERGGPEALPVAINGLGQGLVRAAAMDARAVVRAVSSATQAALALVPGASVRSLNDVTVSVREPVRATDPLEYVVRLPIAVGVAGSELVCGGMRATTVMVTAVVTAVTDIADAAFGRSPQAEMAERAIEERPLTLPEAIAKAPVTLRNGAVAAGGEIRTGVDRARVGFTETLRPRTNTEFLARASDLDNTAATVNTTIIGSDNNTIAPKIDAVKPNRPRPVLGAIKTVAGTLKAVRDGLRTALGLPPRKGSTPRPEVAAEKEAAPAS